MFISYLKEIYAHPCGPKEAFGDLYSPKILLSQPHSFILLIQDTLYINIPNKKILLSMLLILTPLIGLGNLAEVMEVHPYPNPLLILSISVESSLASSVYVWPHGRSLTLLYQPPVTRRTWGHNLLSVSFKYQNHPLFRWWKEACAGMISSAPSEVWEVPH